MAIITLQTASLGLVFVCLFFQSALNKSELLILRRIKQQLQPTLLKSLRKSLIRLNGL